MTGLSIYNQKTQEFEFRPGPIMAQVVLADEINRATPKTQSSLLECMDERQATIDGTTYRCPTRSWSSPPRTRSSTRARSPCRRPSSTGSCSGSGWAIPQPIDEIVILDEQKRTHPSTTSSEVVGLEELREMQAAIREVHVESSISDYIVRLVNGTRNHPDVYLGASPRGSIALYRASQALAGLLGRDYVIPDDVKLLAEPALAHRLIIKTSSTIHDVQAGQVIRELLETLPVEPIRAPCRRSPAISRHAAGGDGRGRDAALTAARC